MNSAEYVANYIASMKNQGVPLSEVAWRAAVACTGWAYVFGARGQYCTPANRRSRYNGTSDDHGKDKTNIKDKCKNFNASSSENCVGCEWYPSSKFTRFFDCRGFTYWILNVVYGWELMGAGCTTQWNNQSNWKAKGEVKDGIPEDTIVCLFYYKKDSAGRRTNTLEHTGFYYNGETVECSGKVIHKTSLDKKWEVWAVPMCVEGVPPTPIPANKPTLRKGSSGVYVALMQTLLIDHGFSVGPSGADGRFGSNTLEAVKDFQRASGLVVDGVCGKNTWAALESGEKELYSVTVEHVNKAVADEIISKYGGTMKKE